MFFARKSGAKALEVVGVDDAHGASWLDLLNPTDDEIALCEKITGQRVPRKGDLQEIESSSRLFNKDNTLYLSTPLVRRLEDRFFASPLGFVLMPDLLITIRFTSYSAFDAVSQKIESDATMLTGDEVTVLLLEAIVDRLADILEHLGQSLDIQSREIFQAAKPSRGNVAERLRQILRSLGRSGDLSSSVRDSLLGLERVSIYIAENKFHDVSPKLHARLATVGRDISSLNDFVSQISNKVQFLLDATLGFISIEQNDGMKVLTVVSFIGVMPTLIAGIYGMNFKDMPELGWRYGYAYCLVLMAVSVIIPLLLFRKFGWFGKR